MKHHEYSVTLWFKGADQNLIDTVTHDVSDTVARHIERVRSVIGLRVYSRQESSVHFLATETEAARLHPVINSLTDGIATLGFKQIGEPTHA